MCLFPYVPFAIRARSSAATMATIESQIVVLDRHVLYCGVCMLMVLASALIWHRIVRQNHEQQPLSLLYGLQDLTLDLRNNELAVTSI